MKWTKENGRQAENPEKEVDERKRKKGSTSGTAVGAKLERMKGNKQKAEYQKPEKKHGKPGGREGGR